MLSPHLRRELTQVCLNGCLPKPLTGMPQHHKSTTKSRTSSAAWRHDFAAKTTSFFPNAQFTDHESLPSLQESYAHFTKDYPKYFDTNLIDRIRAQEYYHLTLSNHICLDYIGIGLFSHSQAQSQYSTTIPVASSSPPQNSDFAFFSLSYKSVNLKSELLHGGQGSELESAFKTRIMDFLNISVNDYSMVFTANRSSAFKLVAESYPFQSSRKLLTVYDYRSEAVDAMINTSEKRGAKVLSAEFKWPTLRVHSAKLRKMILRKRKKKISRGLFVFPLWSRMTGTSHSYQWMNLAQENGWHVLLDACALGPKDMDRFGLSLFQPDFLICSFYKVFGENPTGFGCLFVKKSTIPLLKSSTSMGIVSLIPAKQILLPEYSSIADTEPEQAYKFKVQEDKLTTLSSFSGSIVIPKKKPENFEKDESVEVHRTEGNLKEKESHSLSLEQGGLRVPTDLALDKNIKLGENSSLLIQCKGLDHLDSLGLTTISSRARCLINWLVNSLMKLQHPNAENRAPLVRIYGPKIKFNRGPALAFNVYDWKGEKVEPALIQKLADRSNISLSLGFLHQIWFADKCPKHREKIVETKKSEGEEKAGNRKKADQGIKVVTSALGFLANFEDVYRLWAFVAQFLDADFLEKERWRYTDLNQKTIEL